MQYEMQSGIKAFLVNSLSSESPRSTKYNATFTQFTSFTLKQATDPIVNNTIYLWRAVKNKIRKYTKLKVELTLRPLL